MFTSDIPSLSLWLVQKYLQPGGSLLTVTHTWGVCKGLGRLSPSPPGQVEMSLQLTHPNYCRQLRGHLLGIADHPKCTRELVEGASFTRCKAGVWLTQLQGCSCSPPRGTALLIPQFPSCSGELQNWRCSQRAPGTLLFP